MSAREYGDMGPGVDEGHDPADDYQAGYDFEGGCELDIDGDDDCAALEASVAADVRADTDAFISWSAIAEPADFPACWLVYMLGPAQALAWVRLASVDRSIARAALRRFDVPEIAEAAVKASEKWIARLDDAEPEPHRERASTAGIRIVTRHDPEWPVALNDLPMTAPFALWVRGNGHVANLWHRSVAVVGARASTSYGNHMATSLSAGLGDHGWTVISGGAYGIDGAAHRAALGAASPTVAVMAGGVDRLYPAGNADMLEAVMERGVVLSEVPPGFAPHRSRFLTRNRLIATAGATVVVEAAYRSGALSTARHAFLASRTVGAVPGPVTSASSTGCHALIRDGEATLVTCAADVLELAQPIGAPVPVQGSLWDDVGNGANRPDFGTPHERQAYDAIGPRGATVAVVARSAGLTLAEARVALGGLELAGLARHDGPNWKKTPA
ncbi:MAG: DNA-protecting protein DprA [Actinobacteria bacterium HGW-Actinobacteria-4]|nr:MAG: DNA-protecting protein DprA [Actinobacteria bacterium HGW-Actinobacteria-4]